MPACARARLDPRPQLGIAEGLAFYMGYCPHRRKGHVSGGTRDGRTRPRRTRLDRHACSSSRTVVWRTLDHTLACRPQQACRARLGTFATRREQQRRATITSWRIWRVQPPSWLRSIQRSVMSSWPDPGRAGACELSDWDFAVRTSDFAAVARDLPALIAPLHPLGQQWEPLGHFPVYQVLLPGPTKVEYLFLDHSHRRCRRLSLDPRRWTPSTHTSGIGSGGLPPRPRSVGTTSWPSTYRSSSAACFARSA